MDQDKPASKKEALHGALFIGATLLFAYLITEFIGIAELKDTAASAGLWGYLAVIVLKITTIIVVPLGGGPIYVIAGAVYGFWTALLITFIGDVIGFTAAFYISRRYGNVLLKYVVPSQHMPMLEKIFARGSEWKTFIKGRIAFATLPEVFAYAAGLTAVSYPLFIVVQMVPHVVSASLAILFGDVLLSGDMLMIVGSSVVAMAFVVIGAWWFHQDITKAA